MWNVEYADVISNKLKLTHAYVKTKIQILSPSNLLLATGSPSKTSTANAIDFEVAFTLVGSLRLLLPWIRSGLRVDQVATAAAVAEQGHAQTPAQAMIHSGGLESWVVEYHKKECLSA